MVNTLTTEFSTESTLASGRAGVTVASGTFAGPGSDCATTLADRATAQAANRQSPASALQRKWAGRICGMKGGPFSIPLMVTWRSGVSRQPVERQAEGRRGNDRSKVRRFESPQARRRRDDREEVRKQRLARSGKTTSVLPRPPFLFPLPSSLFPVQSQPKAGPRTTAYSRAAAVGPIARRASRSHRRRSRRVR